jgi:hypothetical protein
LFFRKEQTMKMCPKMKAVIEQLAQRHDLDLTQIEAHLRLDLPGFDRLVIENIGLNCISVAHYFELNGDLVAEPDVVFYTGRAGEWAPISISQSLIGWRSYAELSEDGSHLMLDSPSGQADLAEFAEQWAENIQAQGWLEHGRSYSWDSTSASSTSNPSTF